MVMRSLPPGFRFHPTDVELVLYYLKRKVMGKRLLYEAISEVNIYKFSPWDLPDKSCLKTKDQEWFFFCPREKKYASGSRVKRATENGYWKTTGKDRTIRCSDKIVGSVKTLVFHLGHAPHGERTDWVIYEYMILDDSLVAAGVQDTYVLCRVFKKNGMGPKNGAQYGAPFNEADWADDEIDDGNHAISFASNCPLPAMPEQTEEQSFHLERIISPGNTSGLPLHHEECPSPSVGGPTGDVADEMDPSPSVGGQTGEVVADEMDPSPSVGGQTVEVVADEMDDEILSLLAPFTDESMLLSHENEISQDQGSWGQMNGSRLDFSVLQNDEYFQNNMLSQDNTTYLELDDLLLPLDCPDGVTRANQSSLCDVLGTPNHDNMQQFLSGDSFAVMRQHAPRANEVPWSDVLQMVNHQRPDSNASYTLDSIFGQLDNANYSANMERGSQKLNSYSSCNPADRLPSAAEHLALTFSSCGGSSIHIKAEVTHGAGECTNEALSVMMGGSCSCWCNSDFFPKLLPLLVNCLLSLVAFAFNLILFYCFSRETVSWSHYYIYNYHPNENSTIILGPSSTSGNLVIYLPRNASLFVFYFSYDLCVSRSVVCGSYYLI